MLLGTMLGLCAPAAASAQWRDTEVPPTQPGLSGSRVTLAAEVRPLEPSWMRRVRTFRRLGGAVFGIGGIVFIAGELAFARGASIDAVFATDIAGSVSSAVGLFTLVGAQIRRRRVRIHLGLRAPMPEHRGRRRRIGGGVLLGLTGVIVAASIVGLSNSTECGDSSECEGTILAVLLPSLIGAHSSISGIALLASGAAARRGARGRVRFSVGASRGVPTLVAQF